MKAIKDCRWECFINRIFEHIRHTYYYEFRAYPLVENDSLILEGRSNTWTTPELAETEWKEFAKVNEIPDENWTMRREFKEKTNDNT